MQITRVLSQSYVAKHENHVPVTLLTASETGCHVDAMAVVWQNHIGKNIKITLELRPSIHNGIANLFMKAYKYQVDTILLGIVPLFVKKLGSPKLHFYRILKQTVIVFSHVIRQLSTAKKQNATHRLRCGEISCSNVSFDGITRIQLIDMSLIYESFTKASSSRKNSWQHILYTYEDMIDGIPSFIDMMAPCYGCNFRITSPLRGESIGYRLTHTRKRIVNQSLGSFSVVSLASSGA